MTHTPRPLTGTWWQDPNDNRIHDEQGNDVLDYLPVTEIGRRVNSHDALVEACKNVEEAWAGAGDMSTAVDSVLLALAQEVRA